MRDQECVAFLQWALPRLDMRWTGFRRVRRQVCKRLGRRIGELELSGAEQYRRYLQEQPEEWDVVDRACRITISRFNRDRSVFDELRGVLLPAMVRRAVERGSPTVAGWSAGCASGEEPYSLRLSWDLGRAASETGVGLEIVATDIDPHLLERARDACYPAGSLKELPGPWIERAFTDSGGQHRLNDEFRADVNFRQQDVREQMPAGNFDIVLCRNLVFTYFDAPLQGRLLSQILERLREWGVLVLGGHESLPAGAWPLERHRPGLPIYRRAPGAT